MTPEEEAERYLNTVRGLLIVRAVRRELDLAAKDLLLARLDRVRALLRVGRLSAEDAGYEGDALLAAARLLPPLVAYQGKGES